MGSVSIGFTELGYNSLSLNKINRINGVSID